MSPRKPAQPAYRDRDCMGTDRVFALRRRSPDHLCSAGVSCRPRAEAMATRHGGRFLGWTCRRRPRARWQSLTLTGSGRLADLRRPSRRGSAGRSRWGQPRRRPFRRRAVKGDALVMGKHSLAADRCHFPAAKHAERVGKRPAHGRGDLFPWRRSPAGERLGA
jgi:hypothetical protein